jgi:hypothetical protein
LGSAAIAKRGYLEAHTSIITQADLLRCAIHLHLVLPDQIVPRVDARTSVPASDGSQEAGVSALSLKRAVLGAQGLSDIRLEGEEIVVRLATSCNNVRGERKVGLLHEIFERIAIIGKGNLDVGGDRPIS